LRNEALFSSDKNFWETPQKLFDELDAEFHFTLDAAASDENHKCARYFTQNDDGLRQNWEGETVFCNPPYGNKETGLWTEKCYREGQKPGTTVVLLIPARTDRASFHDYVLGNAEIRNDMTTLRMISGITYTRKNLEALTGMPDRENRRMIREQRRQGVPIVAMKDGGYKLAETEEEKQALLSMYRKRALDELGTYRRLARAMQVDGQMEMGGGNGTV